MTPVENEDNNQHLSAQFIAALAANEAARFEAVLAEDVTLRIYGWEGLEAYRPRERVVARLMAEWSAWPDARVMLLSSLATGEQKTAVEFRIQATEHGRYVEHNRAAFLTWADGRVTTIELYGAEPIPSARRDAWLAPGSLSDEELNRLFDSQLYQFDPRQGIPAHTGGHLSLRYLRIGSGQAHPGSNTILGARWQPDEADTHIEALIASHRRQGIGFTWLVGPFDTPADLGRRLLRHGFVLAGDQAIMARRGLDELDIPINTEITTSILDGSDEAHAEAGLQILAQCFHWTPERTALRRPSYMEELKNPQKRQEEINYLAWVEGQPAAVARLRLKGSTAHLSGAATLPAFRGRKIYATLLKRRLEDARAYGHQIATIEAQPMSRRIVTRYGFQEYARAHLYAWMPVIDMEVIRSLIPTE